MLKYYGTAFQVTEKFHEIFETMCSEKQRWMGDYSIVVIVYIQRCVTEAS